MRRPRTGVLRAELPVRFKGIGLPRIADIRYADFVGTEEMTVPRFGDETLADGTVVPRLANHLTPFLGDDMSFSGTSNRYLRFIGSGLNLGKAFLHSCAPKWATCRVPSLRLPPRTYRGAVLPRMRIRGPKASRGCSALARAQDVCVPG